MTAPRVAAIALTLALVVLGKTYYRTASADSLAWLLAPTATCVSSVTDTHFVRERGVGWIDRAVAFEIVPECAGLHFLLAALLVLGFAGLPAMTSWAAAARQLALAGAGAYVAALAVNTLRIAIAIRLHERALGGAELHRLEGTVVYLGGLCAVYAAARRLHGAAAA